MSLRLDDLYLVDVIETSERVARMITGADYDSFTTDDMLASAVQYLLIIVGEACGKMRPETLAQMPDVPVDKVRGFRNRLVHAYFDVDLAVVWDVAANHLPELAKASERVLESLFPDTHSRLQVRRQEGLS